MSYRENYGQCRIASAAATPPRQRDPLPVMAATLKSHDEPWWSVARRRLKMARDALVWCAFGLVTAHAKRHCEVHRSLGNRLLPDIPVTRRTLDVGSNVRRVIEANMRQRTVAVDTLPGEILAALLIGRELLDERRVHRNRPVAEHAGVDTREARHRTFGCALVTVICAAQARFCVHVMRELEGLLG